MKKIFSKNFATLLITIILIGISLGLTIFGKYSLGTKHYWGILLILISVILYFINRKAYVVVFVMTLILGLVGLINVFYNDFRIGIGIIAFNPLFLMLLILFLSLGKDELNKLFPEKEK